MITQNSFAGVAPRYICEICHKPLSNPKSVQVGIGPVCRSHQGARQGMSSKNARGTVDMSEWGSQFIYEGYHGHQAHCLIRRVGNALVATEAPDNEGTSITNMAENLATMAARAHGIPLGELVWIEHYVHPASGELSPETFDLVTFEIIGDRFGHPQWKHMGKEEAFKLLGWPLAPLGARACDADLKSARGADDLDG